ncbi:MAG: hypothetical protein IKU47_06290 [Oscillospiraceae bacterium]|nr:hypothetical protein [Oscillospiraceae bacterium]
MKLNKKLLLLVAVMALAFAVSACGGSEPPAPQPPESQTEHQQTVPEDKTETEQNTEAAVLFNTDLVSKEETADGVKYVFNALPQNADDINALLEVYPQSDKHNTAALFMASLVRYIENTDDGLAMIDALKGPQPLSDSDKAFIKERFSDKKYLPKAYFEGAVPENNYEPENPWTIIIYDDPVEAPEGYSYVNVKTSGADNPRRICMRIKDDNHYLWEYNGVFLSIRLPAEEDPWL